MDLLYDNLTSIKLKGYLWFPEKHNPELVLDHLKLLQEALESTQKKLIENISR